MKLENDKLLINVDEKTGAIDSFYLKEPGYELIGEKRLAANFRICAPAEDYLCNYVDGMLQIPISVVQEGNCIRAVFSGMNSGLGRLNIELTYTITLLEDQVVFKSCLTNNCDYPVSEFWFPRLGGWTQFDPERDAKLASPDSCECSHNYALFKQFPGGKGLGSEAAEFASGYPGMQMPWWDIYDKKSDKGLYLGYHDTTYRFSTWHTYLCPNVSGIPWDTMIGREDACGIPVGLIFSHVRYPFIEKGEKFESGEFIIRLHDGDWHYGSLFYRDWFLKHFPIDKSNSWLRKTSAWFSSIIYQPEDKVITDYEGYGQWCRDAQEFDVNCFELIGWDKGGLERDYPQYEPEEKLGGREGFRKLLKEINESKGKCLVFVNYNILDSCTEWYRKELHQYAHQDQFGNTPNWMAWGESTLLARSGVSTRRHHLASVVPPMVEILEDYFLKLVEDGAHGFQIDKLCVAGTLDFNPLNTEKPDTAGCEGIVRSIARLLEKCRSIDPAFCIASEAVVDRLIPYIDVYYRASGLYTIAPLRYVFPEWTSCQHFQNPFDYPYVNSAVLTGSVMCIDPETYQDTLKNPMWEKLALYIKEVERIRRELAGVIFTGRYYDTLYASVRELDCPEKEKPAGLLYRVHGSDNDDRRAIVVVNTSAEAREYSWEFTHRKVGAIKLYEPFMPVRDLEQGCPVEIKSLGLHIIVAAVS